MCAKKCANGSLLHDEKRLYARQKEAFAAQLTHADYEFGRIVDTLERIGELNNTLIIIVSDNGASGEGGLGGVVHVAPRWVVTAAVSTTHNIRHCGFQASQPFLPPVKVLHKVK